VPKPLALTPHDDMSGAVLQGTALLNTLISGLFPAAISLASAGGLGPLTGVRGHFPAAA
jgi:hypothetical protein